MAETGSTLTGVVAIQPVAAIIYVIVQTPDTLPVTTTVPDPTDARVLLLLLHTPPLVVSLSVTEDPAHTIAGVPRIAVIGLTVMVTLLVQPEMDTI